MQCLLGQHDATSIIGEACARVRHLSDCAAAAIFSHLLKFCVQASLRGMCCIRGCPFGASSPPPLSGNSFHLCLLVLRCPLGGRGGDSSGPRVLRHRYKLGYCVEAHPYIRVLRCRQQMKTTRCDVALGLRRRTHLEFLNIAATPETRALLWHNRSYRSYTHCTRLLVLNGTGKEWWCLVHILGRHTEV